MKQYSQQKYEASQVNRLYVKSEKKLLALRYSGVVSGPGWHVHKYLMLLSYSQGFVSTGADFNSCFPKEFIIFVFMLQL